MPHKRVTIEWAIRNLRQSLGLNLSQFARLIDISRSHAARLEKPRANPRLNLLYRLRAAGMDWSLCTKEHAAICEDPKHLGFRESSQFNDPNDPDSEVVIDDDPPHMSITVGELRKQRAHEVGDEGGAAR